MAEPAPHYAVTHERRSSPNSVDDDKKLEEGVPIEPLDGECHQACLHYSLTRVFSTKLETNIAVWHVITSLTAAELTIDGKELAGVFFDDPNLDKEHLGFDDESPYPEVRSAVANTDDPTMPVSTLRSWIIGTIWAILIPGLNQFFFFRFPSITITGIVAQLLSFPVGRAFAAFLPNWSIFGMELNPGPFTVKEHVLVTVSVFPLRLLLRIENCYRLWYVPRR
jgi:hypothetical protein